MVSHIRTKLILNLYGTSGAGRSLHQVQPRVIPGEVLPLVGLCVRHVAPYLPEPIGVELSDEGGPPAMSVCPGDDLGGEAAGVEDSSICTEETRPKSLATQATDYYILLPTWVTDITHLFFYTTNTD